MGENAIFKKRILTNYIIPLYYSEKTRKIQAIYHAFRKIIFFAFLKRIEIGKSSFSKRKGVPVNAFVCYFI